MASFLQRTNPWIESTFLYASSFDPDTFQEKQKEPREEEEPEEVQTNDTIPSGLTPSQPPHPPSYNVGASSSTVPPTPPSRRGKFVQVIHVGGDIDYYHRRSPAATRRDGPTSLPPHLVVHDGEYSAIAFLSPETCEAYIHDDTPLPSRRSLIGISKYTVSTILQCCRCPPAPTTLSRPPPSSSSAAPPPMSSSSSSSHRADDDARKDDPRADVDDLPLSDDDSPDATLPLSEEMQAEVDDAAARSRSGHHRAGRAAHSTILSYLLFTDVPGFASSSSSVPPPPAGRYQLIPTELQVQLLSQVPDLSLYMCLYLQGSIANVGAENGGLIGDPVDVHCSVSLRRALMRHRRLYGGDDNENDDDDKYDHDDDVPDDSEGEGYSHSVLIRRLEAVHCYYYWLDRQRRRNLTFGNDDDDVDDAYERRCRRGGARAKKKQYGRRNRGEGGRGRGGGRDGAGRRDDVSGDDEDVRRIAALADSEENLIPEWPWESRLTAVEPTPYSPLDERRDDNIDPGAGDGRKGGLTVTKRGNGGECGGVGAILGNDDINGLSLEVEYQDEATNATDDQVGELASTTASVMAKALVHRRKQHGDVNELFNSSQDIDDILGLEDDIESGFITTITNRNDEMRPHFEVDAVSGTAEVIAGSSAGNNDEHVTEINDFDGRGEIDDNAPSFVGIDDMMVDDEDDSDDEEKEGGSDLDYFDTNHERDVETQGALTQPPDIERAAHGHPYGDGDDTDEEAMVTVVDDNPESQVILPSYPLGKTSKAKINKEQSADEEVSELEMDPKVSKSKKKASVRPRRRVYESDDTVDANAESQIIVPSCPEGRTSKKKINTEQSADEKESELEMYPKVSKSKKKSSVRPRRRIYDSDEDSQGSQIPIHLRKAPPETLALASTAPLHRGEERLEESQILFPPRKAPMETLASSSTAVTHRDDGRHQESQIPFLPMRAPMEPMRWTVEEVENEEIREEGFRQQESQIPFTRDSKKQNTKGRQRKGEKLAEDLNAKSSSAIRIPKLSKKPTGRNEHPKHVVEKSQVSLNCLGERTSSVALTSSRKYHDDYDDSSDKWMRLRRRKPTSRSRSVASPPKQMKTRAAAATAAAASDESTESIFESQVAGEGSEESVPPPPPQPPIVSSLRKKPSAATTTYLRDDDTDDDEAEQPIKSNREDEDIQEKIHGAPSISAINQRTAHDGGNDGRPDNYRGRPATANFDMSFISTRASIFLGLSTSSQRVPQGESSQSSKMGESGEYLVGNDVAPNNRKRAAKEFDIVDVVERARGLNGL